MLFLRVVPPEVVDGVVSGLYKVTGSVVRDVASGRGVAFLQETSVVQSLLNSALSGVSSTLQNGFSPLGAIALIQNQQIKSRLVEVQSSLALLQNLQIGTLAVSGLGLGVSIAGFAMMLKRLKGIEAQLGAIEAKIDRVTTDRRSDDIRMIFADVGTQLDIVDTLSARSNRVSSAEAAEHALATSSGRLEAHFQQKSEAMQIGPMTSEDMDMLWSLAAAIRLCHEAGFRALYSIDELEAAKQLAERRAQRFLNLSQGLTPDSLARLCAQSASDSISFAEARRLALPQAEVLVHGLRDSVASISSQSELAQNLIENQIPGPAYLEELAGEKVEPLLMLAPRP
ncbi:hypothetical protein [Pseudooceanicola sp.]|uniref:hypothetical protein n=1 Tax=Pseudooceanicola sp. TaxID=1914328 RepID=UPI002608A858|nr:hypothetical protein [Pseudooceanicola sp.]MDF1856564.1 hypothetical protein [Pseudooceanicola sp.]